jgi:hypothetical protein
MFLHKAIKPAQLFVNRILALLREMGEATVVAIDEASKHDIRWFIPCACSINGTVSIYKCLQHKSLRGTSLHGLGRPLAHVSIHILSANLWAGVLRTGRPSTFL